MFKNSRSESEELVDGLCQQAAARGDPDIFYVHHGGLSAAIRGEAGRR